METEFIIIDRRHVNGHHINKLPKYYEIGQLSGAGRCYTSTSFAATKVDPFFMMKNIVFFI